MPKKYPLLTIKEFEEILFTFPVKEKNIKGGHVHLTIICQDNIERTITYQTHEDPVPLYVVQNTIKQLKVSDKDFYSRSKKAARKKNVRFKKQ